MVNQLQIMVATVERRDDVAVRRVTPYVLLTVCLSKRRPKNPAAEKFNPTINFIAIVHPLPTSGLVGGSVSGSVGGSAGGSVSGSAMIGKQRFYLRGVTNAAIEQ